jgi:hypothetical protein
MENTAASEVTQIIYIIETLGQDSEPAHYEFYAAHTDLDRAEERAGRLRRMLGADHFPRYTSVLVNPVNLH